MAKKTIQQRLDPYLTPQNILLFIFGVLSLLIVGSFLFKGSGSEEAAITEDQIRMEKNGEIITVNKNGLVEYRTNDVVTYKIWSTDKVSSFFDAVENKARDYLENPKDTSSCVWVSLYLDGELVTICFSEDDDVVNEAYQEFDEDTGDSISISDLFGDDENEDDETVNDISDYFKIIPTPTTPVVTPTPGGSGGEGGLQLPPPLPIEATCESWEEQIVGGRAIISNTLCSVSIAE